MRAGAHRFVASVAVVGMAAACSGSVAQFVSTNAPVIVAKWSLGRYETDGVGTSWLKIKNPNYSQWEGRRELFEQRRDRDLRSEVHHE